jgi:CcmD family protein
MAFMIAAYVVFWLVTFVFVFSIFSRQRTLQRDLELMEQLLEGEDGENSPPGMEDSLAPDMA